MTRRGHGLLIAGCLVVALLQLPVALRSLAETWHGPYASDRIERAAVDDGAGSADEEARLAADEIPAERLPG